MSNTSMTPKERAALAAAREAEAQRKKRMASATAQPPRTATPPSTAKPMPNYVKSAPQGRPASGRSAKGGTNAPKNKMNTREYPRVPQKNGVKPGTKPHTNGEEREDTGEFPSYVRKGKGGYHPPKPKSRKVIRRRKKLDPKVLAALTAAAALVLIVVILLLCGVRYKSVTLDDGYKITFFGISKGGEAHSGWLSYPGGERGRLIDGSRIKFSDGSVFEGEMLDVARDGSGILTYANGDVYEGEFQGRTS